MRTSGSGVTKLLLLFWNPRPLFFLCCGMKATAASRTSEIIIKKHQGRSIQATSEEGLGEERYNRKKDDKLVEIENPSDPPTLASTYFTQLPTLAASDSTQSPTDPSTTSPTELPSAQLSFRNVEVQLLPFSILIHGSVSMDDEHRIRYELQDYLFDSFWGDSEQLLELMPESIDLEMIQIVESYIPLVDAEEGDYQIDGKSVNNNRSLRYIRRQDGHHVRRNLQSPSSISTISTLIEYKANALILYEHQNKDFLADNELLAFQERQIEVLEDNVDLQDYFLKLFQLVIELDEGVDDLNKDSTGRDEKDKTRSPVVLMAVQVANRPSKSLNSTATWERIESMLDTLNTSDRDIKGNISSDTKPDNMTNESATTPSDISYTSINISNERKHSWKAALVISCIFMIFVSLIGIVVVRRKRSRKCNIKSDQFSKNQLSSSRKIVNHANHQTSDVDSEEGQEAIVKERNNGRDNGMSDCYTTNKTNEIDAGSSKPENAIVTQNDVDRNHSDISANEKKGSDSQTTPEKRPSKKLPFISFIGKPLISRAKKDQKDDLQRETKDNEMDSDRAQINLYNAAANDDDSMMGYSLTSQNRVVGKKEETHDDRNSIEDLESISNASSESDSCNPLFPGIHKILDRDNKSNYTVPYTPQGWNDHEDSSTTLSGEEITNNEQGESHMSADTFEIEHTQEVSDYNDDEPKKEIPARLPAFQVDENNNNYSKYHGKDEIMGDARFSQSDEVRSACAILPLRKNEINSEHIQSKDSVSDAPSDERNNDPSVPLSSISHDNHQTRHMETVRNSKLLDNDPAVLSYLIKNIRDSNEERRDRKVNNLELYR
mmetsp:Transcript_8727/g.21285  ORF Transcript_8727/g.21285 Transcript_8727/m.21285 type:complete len:833 (+) Transcript_8727:146-2644(+)|eukprot:CAMPEP_0197176646 /NCGR_PEP_ID=MMETSP1423-20130617/2499_1 /TAXON_ID=476441 /ORGANISM="Pseudo-nitzschia heimii, Strain UNC1101" /LENGTH=832 /DNA_ID=CAMNT_0042626045 /DNA_START=60 /DNA_END=2558 /DNA_ORIENTATION=+